MITLEELKKAIFRGSPLYCVSLQSGATLNYYKVYPITIRLVEDTMLYTNRRETNRRRIVDTRGSEQIICSPFTTERYTLSKLYTSKELAQIDADLCYKYNISMEELTQSRLIGQPIG
jgi:hypothetical protein